MKPDGEERDFTEKRSLLEEDKRKDHQSKGRLSRTVQSLR